MGAGTNVLLSTMVAERHMADESHFSSAWWRQYVKQPYLGDVTPLWVRDQATAFSSFDCLCGFMASIILGLFFKSLVLFSRALGNLCNHCWTVSYAFVWPCCAYITGKTCVTYRHLHVEWCPDPLCTGSQCVHVRHFHWRASGKSRL